MPTVLYTVTKFNIGALLVVTFIFALDLLDPPWYVRWPVGTLPLALTGTAICAFSFLTVMSNFPDA